jgi:hypothetical protein
MVPGRLGRRRGGARTRGDRVSAAVWLGLGFGYLVVWGNGQMGGCHCQPAAALGVYGRSVAGGRWMVAPDVRSGE